MASHEIDFGAAQWRKSSYSNGTGGECVEVAPDLPATVPVRDSKQAGAGPVLRFRPSTWAAFLASVKA
ncbi:DUF397 domain-containing protein [Streptomyces dysideae]|uniref:DUF397 domain-containing protein n=1 Tax=Streptomyces dysideae TaxID=909626 RepID=A0A124IDE6_9ACTN|nr:DUF397 domain-containing protein [Streptomyces dysideae]KUO14855.1 hypothetical protein AQJ91_44630 [Streptomyces dysideae]